MGRKRIPGLALRGGAWHIDKRIYGRRICQSTGTPSLDEAERYLAKVMEDARQAEIYSVRPSRTFEQAAAKFVLENRHKRSINCDIGTGTINHGLQVVRRILNLASGEWMDERGLTWLLAPPKVKLFAN